jgi:cytochrome c biogenesis protein CcmG/thiol:disulfide interchange protein DsbE
VAAGSLPGVDPPAAGRGRPRRRIPPVPALSVGVSVLLLALLAVGVRLSQAGGPDRVSFDAPDRTAGFQTLAPGSRAAPLALPALGGGRLDLAAYRGRPVVVNFWASWCEPCKRELPLLRRALADHAADRLAVVGVVVRDSPAAAGAFAARTGARWPMGLDPQGRAAGTWGVANLPQTFFVRPDGTVASRQLGELRAPALQAQIDAIVGG